MSNSNPQTADWESYNFVVCPLNVKLFNDIISDKIEFKGNYIFSKLIGNEYHPVYIGQSDTVASRILDRINIPKDNIDKLIFYYSTEVHIRVESTKSVRDLIEIKFIGNYNPPLNYELRTGLANKIISGPVPDRRRDKYGNFI